MDVLDFHELLPVIMGIPQGESLSPILSNIYLDPLDKHLEHLRVDFVRYADDIIILTNSEADAKEALQVLHDFLLDPLRLELKPAKTNYVSLEEGFDYLGFKINKNSIEVKKNKLDDVQEMVRGHIQHLGQISATLQQRTDAIMLINAVIRGFRNYFALADEKRIDEQMRFLDGRIEQMANFYLPPNIRDDPVWICRDRFCLPGTQEDAESEKEEEERKACTGGGYPDGDRISSHDKWMVKDKGSDEDAKNKTSVVIEDPGDDNESNDGNLNNSYVEDGDRLYVLTNGSYITVSENDLIVKKKKVEIYRRPLNELGLVFLQGFGMNISINLQLRLAELGIPAVFSPPIGTPIAVLNPISTSKSFIRSRQVLRRDDPDIIGVGLDMLSSKVGNQAAVLKYFAKYRNKSDPNSGRLLSETAQKISNFAANIRALDPGSASVRTLAMGYEGHAAALYWRQLMHILPAAFGFTGRVTKTGRDKVNQCLNYVYGILYGEVWRAVVKAGLDPYFGLIHGSKRDQGSLVFDLIEEFRAPFADRLIIGMIGRGFQPEIGDHGFLKTRTRRQLAIGFSKRWLKKIPWRSQRLSPAVILEKQAASLAKLFNYEGHYRAFKMRW